MRKLSLALATLILSAGFVALPAQAAVPIDGTYDCITGLPSNDPPSDGEMPGLILQSGVLVSSAGCRRGNDYADAPIISVTIPEGTIELGPQSLGWLFKVSSISIPDSVLRIGDAALIDNRLTSVTIPQNVASIGDRAFFGSRNLESVTFAAGSNLESIGSDVFFDTPVTSLELPASLRYFGDQEERSSLTRVSFASNSLLESLDGLMNSPTISDIEFGAGGTFANDEAGAIYNSLVSELLYYPRTRVGPFTLPATVTRIAEDAFRGTLITQILIPSTITSIGRNAFREASLLTNVTFAPGIELESIESSTFRDSGLTSVVIPASVLRIGNNGFAGIESLSSVTFANNSLLETIGEYAFEYTILTSVAIPKNVYSIASNAFNRTRLSSINVVEPNQFFTSEDGVLFDDEKVTLLKYPEFKANTYYSVPASVQTIGREAFKRSSFLTSVSIPASVSEIEYSAFEQATALSNVSFAVNSGLTQINDWVFSELASLKTMTLPSSISRIHIFSFYGSALERMTFLGNQFQFLTYSDEDLSRFEGVREDLELCIDPTKAWDEAITDRFGCGHKLSFVTNGGSPVSMELFKFLAAESDEPEIGDASSQVSRAEITEPSESTRAGYTFSGWSTTEGGSTEVFPLILDGPPRDVVFYAKWTAIPGYSNESVGAPQNNAQPSPPQNNSQPSPPQVTPPVVSVPVALGVPVASYTMVFSSGSNSLATQGQADIKKLVTKSGPDAKYTISAGASLVKGLPRSFVSNLAKARAAKIKSHLLKLGVRSSDISIKLTVNKAGQRPVTKITVKK